MRTIVGSRSPKRSPSGRSRSGGSNRPRSSKPSSRPSGKGDSTRPSKIPSQSPENRDSLPIEISDLEVPIEIRDSEISSSSMLGNAGVPSEAVAAAHESDETIIAPLTDELNEVLGIPDRADDDFAEGEDFLRSVTEEFEKE